MTIFMYLHNKRILLVFLVSYLFFQVMLSGGGADENISIGKIWAAAYMGRDTTPIEISPLSEIEHWQYGEFDPSQIWLKVNIFAPSGESVDLKIYKDMKIGDLKFEKKGIDVNHLVKTARWCGEQLLLSEKLFIAKDNKSLMYEYKHSLDSIMSDLISQKRWPYILKFKFTAKYQNKEVTAKKIIVFTPDNKTSY